MDLESRVSRRQVIPRVTDPIRTEVSPIDDRTCPECSSVIEYIRLTEGEYLYHPCGCPAPDPRDPG
jgi:hypothetical protein